jgi:preprotein translocase subunit Sss1
MRYGTVLVTGYTAVVLVMVGVVGYAVNHQRELTNQQNRDVDAAINQIVARHQERKRLAALGVTQPEIQVAAYTRTSEPSSETTGSAVTEAAAPETLRAAGTKPVTVLQSARKPGRRAGRKHDHFLPTALASLPKLTTYTLLGLK